MYDIYFHKNYDCIKIDMNRGSFLTDDGLRRSRHIYAKDLAPAYRWKRYTNFDC